MMNNSQLNDIYYITEEQLKEITSIQSNVDSYELLKYIPISQSKWVDDILGSDLVKDLKEAIYDKDMNGVDISDEYMALLEEIKYPVAWFAFFEATTFLNFKTSKAGIGKKYTDNTENLDYQEFAQYRSEIKDNADHYNAKLATFLYDNQSDYPLYVPHNEDNRPPNSGGQFMVY